MSNRPSILIRTKNEARSLGTTLQAVFEQSVRAEEVLVLDSGSTDGTLDVAARFPVRVITMPASEWSYPKALNVGFDAATGNVVVCLSAHCRPMTIRWLELLVRHFDDPAVAGTWGAEIFSDRGRIEPGPPRIQEPGHYGSEYAAFGLSNANSAIRRSVWEQVPFDESLPAAEDRAWGLAVLRAGYRIVYEPAAAVRHELHGFAREYKRDRAVLEGLSSLFPETHTSFTGNLKRLLASARRILADQLRNPNRHEVWRLAKRIPVNLSTLGRTKQRRHNNEP